MLVGVGADPSITQLVVVDVTGRSGPWLIDAPGNMGLPSWQPL
jgi:hypothetical protein